MDLSILIVNYETDRLLEECCRSLEAGCAGLAWEAVVVDNGSRDGSADFLERPGLPGCRLIRTGANLGFARGNNTALAEARGRLALLLNPDTWAFPGALAELAGRLDPRPDLGAVGPRTWLDRQRTLEVCALKLPEPLLALAAFSPLGRLRPLAGRLEAAWAVDRALAAQGSGELVVGGLGGACLMVRTEQLRRLGGLDESFYMGYEDTDLSRRIGMAGRRLAICVAAEIVHYFGHSKRKRGSQDAHLYDWDKGLRRYLDLHHGRLPGRLLAAAKRLERRRRPEPPGPAGGTGGVPAVLEWPDGRSPYLLEISNSPRFLDKFMGVRQEPRLHLPAELASRLAPGRYWWRAVALERPDWRRPLGSGSFLAG